MATHASAFLVLGSKAGITTSQLQISFRTVCVGEAGRRIREEVGFFVLFFEIWIL